MLVLWQGMLSTVSVRETVRIIIRVTVRVNLRYRNVRARARIAIWFLPGFFQVDCLVSSICYLSLVQ